MNRGRTGSFARSRSQRLYALVALTRVAVPVACSLLPEKAPQLPCLVFPSFQMRSTRPQLQTVLTSTAGSFSIASYALTGT